MNSSLVERDFMCSFSTPTIWYDNLSSLALASNHMLHARTKCVELDLHFICEKVLSQQLAVQYIPLHEQPVYILTKPLHIFQFLLLRKK